MASPVRAGRRLGGGLTAVVLGPLLLGLASCTSPGGSPGPSTSAGDPTTAAPPPAAGSATPTATPTAGTATSDPSPTATPSSTCADLVGRLSLEERVGQLLMVAVSSTGVTAEQAAAVARTRAGSVILLGNSTAGLDAVRQVVADARDAAVHPQSVEVLLAADQEGGRVQRLAGEGFSDIPSAQQQAELEPAELTSAAEGWAAQLVEAGIDADLAPVADVVPRDLTEVNEPIGQLRRGYGASPSLVARQVAAFIRGMDAAGVATAVKHFPGLGRVRGNTDFARRVVDSTTTRDDAGLAGFQAAVDADVDMVMVSSAIYPRIDGRRPAVFSPTVLDGMIRAGLGFEGVVISDDLSAAAVQDVPAERRGVDFVRAGGDLAIVGDAAEAVTIAAALVERAEDDPELADRVDASVARVLALKQRRGLVDC